MDYPRFSRRNRPSVVLATPLEWCTHVGSEGFIQHPTQWVAPWFAAHSLQALFAAPCAWSLHALYGSCSEQVTCRFTGFNVPSLTIGATVMSAFLAERVQPSGCSQVRTVASTRTVQNGCGSELTPNVLLPARFGRPSTSYSEVWSRLLRLHHPQARARLPSSPPPWEWGTIWSTSIERSRSNKPRGFRMSTNGGSGTEVRTWWRKLSRAGSRNSAPQIQHRGEAPARSNSRRRCSRDSRLRSRVAWRRWTESKRIRAAADANSLCSGLSK